MERAEILVQGLGYEVTYDFLDGNLQASHQEINPRHAGPLIVFVIKDIQTGQVLSGTHFSCTWNDNDVPHPLIEQDVELWGEELSAHPVLELEGKVSRTSLESARRVPSVFHCEGMRFGSGAQKATKQAMIAAMAEVCGGLIYSHDGALPAEANGLEADEFLTWCRSST